MSSLNDLDMVTKAYSDSRDLIGMRVRRMQDIIENVKRRLLPGIKSAVIQAKSNRETLAALIETSTDLFVKPKTLVMHGVKIGFHKGKGAISYTDKDKVVQLIEKHFPEQSDELVKTKKTPIKSALERLTSQDLRKLGISFVAAGDQVLIKPINSDIDKLVDALLGERDTSDTDDAA
jgi:hypothetical protein